jgi:hypothetical protein
MAQRQGSAGQERRPRAKTPAERADEAADVQRRLKQEAAERRETAARKSKPAGRLHVGSSAGHGRASGRRHTP